MMMSNRIFKIKKGIISFFFFVGFWLLTKSMLLFLITVLSIFKIADVNSRPILPSSTYL